MQPEPLTNSRTVSTRRRGDRAIGWEVDGRSDPAVPVGMFEAWTDQHPANVARLMADGQYYGNAARGPSVFRPAIRWNASTDARTGSRCGRSSSCVADRHAEHGTSTVVRLVMPANRRAMFEDASHPGKDLVARVDPGEPGAPVGLRPCGTASCSATSTSPQTTTMSSAGNATSVRRPSAHANHPSGSTRHGHLIWSPTSSRAGNGSSTSSQACRLKRPST